MLPPTENPRIPRAELGARLPHLWWTRDFIVQPQPRSTHTYPQVWNGVHALAPTSLPVGGRRQCAQFRVCHTLPQTRAPRALNAHLLPRLGQSVHSSAHQMQQWRRRFGHQPAGLEPSVARPNNVHAARPGLHRDLPGIDHRCRLKMNSAQIFAMAQSTAPCPWLHVSWWCKRRQQRRRRQLHMRTAGHPFWRQNHDRRFQIGWLAWCERAGNKMTVAGRPV